MSSITNFFTICACILSTSDAQYTQGWSCTDISLTKWFLTATFSPYAVGGLFGQYKMMQKPEKRLKPSHMDTHLRVLSESYLMNTLYLPGPSLIAKWFVLGVVPYYPAYNTHPIDNTHPPPQVPFPYIKYNALFYNTQAELGEWESWPQYRNPRWFRE